jgi:hypothetical protein
VTEVISVKHAKLVADSNAMYAALGRQDQLSEHAMNKIVDSLKKRLEKAKTANFPNFRSLQSFLRGYTATLPRRGDRRSLCSLIMPHFHVKQ